MSNFFRAILVQPLFNLLFIIYALIPGNDFGVALILFTIAIRLLMWPLLKKQLHQQKAMRELQPEIAKIKQRAKGDKQKEAQAMMELYKEKEINPLGSLGVVFLQLPILLALFYMLREVVNDHGSIEHLSYSLTASLDAVKEIIANPGTFHPSLLGVVDLSKHALDNGVIYWPAVPFILLAGIGQFVQSRQITTTSRDRKNLRQLLRDAQDGKEVSQAEQQAAMTSSMTYFFPVLTIVIGLSFPAALSLYWAASSFVAVIQQRLILGQDLKEMAAVEVKTSVKKPKKSSKNKRKAGK